MKIIQWFLALVLLIAQSPIATGFTQTGDGATQELLGMPIDDLDLEAANIGLLLSEFAAKKKVPIGLEVSAEDNLLRSKTMRLQIKNGTLADALNSIVKQIRFTPERYKTR